MRLELYMTYIILVIIILPIVLVLSGNNQTNTVGAKADIFEPESVEETDVKDANLPVGLKYASVKNLWDKGFRGQGIKVGIIDSGVHSSHKEFAGTSIHSRNKIPDDFDGSNVHGTHVAGTVAAKGVRLYGAAPKCEIYDYRIFANENSTGRAQKVSGDIGLLVSSLDQAHSDGCHIVNLSLGIPIDFSPIRTAIHRAYNKGITIVSAAGNRTSRNRGNKSYPAMYDTVISVGAMRINGKAITKADFSMDNPQVNIWADGHKVLSTLPHQKYGLLSGTSMASPLVTGAIAAHFSYLKSKGETPNPQKARDFLAKNTFNISGIPTLKLKAVSTQDFEVSEQEANIEIEVDFV